MTDLTLHEVNDLSAEELSKFLEEEACKMFDRWPPKKHAEGTVIIPSSSLESATLKDLLKFALTFVLKSPFSYLPGYFLSHARKLYRF